MKLSQLPIIVQFLDLIKRSSLPGFSGVSIYNVISFVWNEAMKEDNDIVTRSNSIAFNFFLSLFPTIIFLFTLLPILPYSADYLNVFRDSTQSFLPNQAHNYLFNMLADVVSTPRSGLLSVGFIFAMVFSSSGMVTLMYGFQKSYERVFKRRSYIKNRIVAIFLTILVAGLFVISMFMIIFGQPFLELAMDKLSLSSYSAFIFNFTKWWVVVIIIYSGITVIYRYGSSMRKRITWINTGAILATFLSILTSLIFSFFINSFGRYNEIYGSIGALIVLLLWIQINIFIILIGFEINAGIAVNQSELFVDRTKDSKENLPVSDVNNQIDSKI